MDRREAFKRWLQNEKVKKTGRSIPEKFIKSYLKGVSQLSDVMYEQGTISKRLYSMTSPEEIMEATKVIVKDRTYINMNAESENKLHKALDYYYQFSLKDQKDAMEVSEEE